VLVLGKGAGQPGEELSVFRSRFVLGGEVK
jgi:hypothetical protein